MSLVLLAGSIGLRMGFPDRPVVELQNKDAILNEIVLKNFLFGAKGITDASVCPNKLSIKIFINFIAQPANEHVHHVGLRIEIIFPDVF